LVCPFGAVIRRTLPRCIHYEVVNPHSIPLIDCIITKMQEI
jgi:hypothetical protein